MTARELAVAAPELVGDGPLLGSLDRLRTVRDLGVHAVELWSPWQVTEHDAADVGAALAAAGMRVVCVSTPSYLHGEKTGRGHELVASSIRIAQVLGAPRVNTYFGHGGDGDDHRAARRYAQLVAPLLDQAAAAGVLVALENEFDGFGVDPEHRDVSRRAASLADLVAVVDHPAFRLTFDAANFLCAGEDVRRAAALLARHVGYVHVKDVVELRAGDDDGRGDEGRDDDGRDGAAPGWSTYRDGARTFATTELGTGDVPWPAVLDELDRVGYDGPLTLEPHCRRDILADQLRVSVRRLGDRR